MQAILFCAVLAITLEIVSMEFNETSDNSTIFTDSENFRNFSSEFDADDSENGNKSKLLEVIKKVDVSEIRKKIKNATEESNFNEENWMAALRAPHPDKKLRELRRELAKQKQRRKEIQLQKEKAEEKEKKSAKKQQHRKHHKSNSGGKKPVAPIPNSSDGDITGRKSKKKHHDKKRHPRKDDKPDPYKHLKECTDCDPTEKKKRIASFRRQILEKLRVEKVPTKRSPPPLLPPQYDPEHMQNDWLDEEDESFYAQTKELIIQSTDVSRHCAPRHATGCYYLDLKGKVTGYVTSAKLWVFKNRDQNDKQQSFTISELEPDTSYNYTKLRPMNIVDRIETDVKKGWLQFNMTSAVRRWLEKPHMNDGFSIRCKTCYNRNHRVLFGAKEGYKPVLVIHLGGERRRRGRRSIDCTPGETQCCRQQFYIDFEDIENFVYVLRPKGIWANYCTGSCHGVIQTHHNHTELMQGVRWRSNINDTFRDEITPCCAPISYLNKSMLIVEPSGDISYKEIPNVAVHACGCV